MKLAVMIPTFRRPELLRHALDSLRKQSHARFGIVVSDNDAAGMEGRAAASAWAAEHDLGGRVHVTVAHERGLSQNRNNGLAFAFDQLGADAVAMMDDDSEAHPEWLSKLKQACENGAGLIGGPTIYRLPEGASDYVRNSSMFGVPFAHSGFVPRLRSSNNCLVTRAVFERSAGRVFDPAFGASGGEDTFLFMREKKRGTRFWWQSDAIIFEDVPMERCTREWIAHRQITTAVNAARIDRRLSPPGVAWVRQPYLATKDAINAALHVMRGGDRDSALEYFHSATGRLKGLMGRINLHDTAKRA